MSQDMATPASPAPFFDEEEYSKCLLSLVTSRRRIVYATAFNSAGTHVAAGNSDGQVNIFDWRGVAQSLNSFPSLGGHSPARSKSGDALLQIQLGDGAVYSLYTHGERLFCGTVKGITSHNWENLLRPEIKEHKYECRTAIHPSKTPLSDSNVEVNALTGSHAGNSMFAATGLGTVASFTADRLCFGDTFNGGGPGAYCHCITMLGSQEANSFVTGGEDGYLRIYDRRAGSKPQRHFRLRALTGSSQDAWVGCVASDPDGRFIVCGDGNKNLTSIHVASGSMLGTTKLEYVPNAMVYEGGEVYCGGGDQLLREDGQSGKLYRYGLDCVEAGTANSSASGVYALAVHPSSGCMTAAGYSARGRSHDADELVDVYINPPIRSFHMRAPDPSCDR